jgi:hypothetical protein
LATNSADPALAAASSAATLGSELSSIPQVTNITINKDNVLWAATIIQNMLDNDGRQIRQALLGLHVSPPGTDLVSVRAAELWNQRLLSDPDSYASRVEQYLAQLETLASNLRTSAKQYGYTDEQIAAAFNQAGGTGA